MEKFVITGGKPLKGEFSVRGSKNAASKMMIASLLTDEPCVIENIPLSAETDITRELCEHIGSTVEIDQANHRCAITTKEITRSRVSQLSRKNRIPILAFGPLLHRKGVAQLPVLGGCPIGHRPINFHIEALKRMGVYIQRREHSYYASVKKLQGANISLPYPSVGATENIILAGTLAKGTTIITNAATEPEIINLIDMLKSMGAAISIDEQSRTILIEGVSKLRGASVKVMPDRNEVVSIASCALATNGDVFIPDIQVTYLQTFLEKLDGIGAHHEIKNGGIRFWGSAPYRATSIATAPHPGFMTDWQQPLAVLLTQAQGQSSIHETVYDDRLAYLQELAKMGARVSLSKECLQQPCRFARKNYLHSAIITGPSTLNGAGLTIPDLRAGMALIIAALTAKGVSHISGVQVIDRGYEALDDRLRILGADIKRM